MLASLRRRALTLLAILCLCATVFAQSRPRAAADMELPLSAEQTAAAIGVKPVYDRLRDLAAHPDTSDRFELLYLQQQALLQVTSASLQVDASAEAVDAEIGEIRELQNYLTSRRDTRVDHLNLMALVLGGVAGTASSALGFTSHDNAASVLGVLGGAAATSLSFAGLRVSKGESHELMVQSNMLSEVFEHPSDVNNVYPQVVVSFMDAIAPNDEDGLSRQDRLIKNWVDIGRIPDPKTDQGQQKVDRLVSLPGQKVRQSIADLDDRQAMLYDLRVRMNYMKLDLAILMGSLSKIAVPLSALNRSSPDDQITASHASDAATQPPAPR